MLSSYRPPQNYTFMICLLLNCDLKKKNPVTTKHKSILDQIFGTTSLLVIQLKCYRSKHVGQSEAEKVADMNISSTFDGWLQTR